LSNDLYDEKLKHFKENEKPEVVLLIGDDPVLTKIVLAWTNTAVRRAGKLTPLRGHSEDETWRWLWRNAKYSMEELISKSAESQYGFEHKLAPLIGNRVLYPDGTINSFVERYLREKVLKLFDAKPRRGRRKTT